MPVMGHIDLMALQLGSVHLIAPEAEDLFSRYWNSTKRTIPEHLGSAYPEDVKLSSERVENYLLCRPSSASRTVKEYALQHELQILPVKQGYVRCSLCHCSEEAFITDDPSIASALENHTRVKLLQISKGDIVLPGYPYGFIGGASGKIGDTLYFFGSLDSLRDADKVKAFLQDRHISYVSLSKEHPLTDIGGIMDA